MADKDQDIALREAAKARGFRLVKSRRRKPGGDFGRYGLVGLDSGRECLGFGDDGLTATAEQVLAYLRGGEVASWKRSLIGVVGEEEGGSRSKSRSPAKAGAQKARPVTRTARSSEDDRLDPGRRRGAEKAGPKPPAPRLKAVAEEPVEENNSGTPTTVETTIREAARRDAAALAKLLAIPAAALAQRLAAAIKADEPPLVATRGEAVIGAAAWTILSALDRDPRGRITLLMVAKPERRQGTGSALLEAIEQRLADAGVAEVELLLNIDFDAPAAFLRRTGWERRTNGYGKALA